MSKTNRQNGPIHYQPVDAAPKPRRAWRDQGWKAARTTASDSARKTCLLQPGLSGDLPVGAWIGRILRFPATSSSRSVKFQDEMDDHGIEEWPDEEWERWVQDGKRLVRLVRRELGPSVRLEVASEFAEDKGS